MSELSTFDRFNSPETPKLIARDILGRETPAAYALHLAEAYGDDPEVQTLKDTAIGRLVGEPQTELQSEAADIRAHGLRAGVLLAHKAVQLTLPRQATGGIIDVNIAPDLYDAYGLDRDVLDEHLGPRIWALTDHGLNISPGYHALLNQFAEPFHPKGGDGIDVIHGFGLMAATAAMACDEYDARARASIERAANAAPIEWDKALASEL